ncbi:MAG: Tyrosine recombinase XerD [Bacteroidota bacterium]|nr:MAG: Tyrosine recombinase XerD [Bacteroidota bacterium]
MQWKKAIEEYSFHLRLEQGLSENTIESYQFDVNRLASYCEKLHSKITPISLKTDTLKDFVFELSKEVQPPTQSRIVSGIKGFFAYMQLEGYREDNPTQLLELPKIRKTFPDTLSTDEVNALIAGIDSKSKYAFRNRCMLELLYSCGLRVSELTQLNKSDLFFEKGLIRIRGKGDKLRWVPVAESSSKLIHEYIQKEQKPIKGYEDRVFLNNRGKELTRAMVFTIVKKAALCANLNKKVSPHTLRHSFATHLVENGADIQLVQHMMGHASITTTERYIHMSQRHLKEAIARFHPRAT